MLKTTCRTTRARDWHNEGKLLRPVGALPILYFQTQGGARSSLALGCLVAGCWPEETSDPRDEQCDGDDGFDAWPRRGRTSQPRAKRACERRPGSTARNIIKPQRGGTANNQAVVSIISLSRFSHFRIPRTKAKSDRGLPAFDDRPQLCERFPLPKLHLAAFHGNQNRRRADRLPHSNQL